MVPSPEDRRGSADRVCRYPGAKFPLVSDGKRFRPNAPRRLLPERLVQHRREEVVEAPARLRLRGPQDPRPGLKAVEPTLRVERGHNGHAADNRLGGHGLPGSIKRTMPTPRRSRKGDPALLRYKIYPI